MSIPTKMTFNFTYNYPQVARDSGFKLRNYKDGPLDWRLVGSMEIERILKDQSFEQIDVLLNHLAEVPLGSILESNILDSGISKYFMLSQFSLQYLIFCRKFLEETVADLREAHSVSQMELATVKRNLSEANNEILQLHKKITQMEAIHEIIYPCHLCTKNFVSNDALNLHIVRKHNVSLANPEKRCEPPQGLYKERENDLSLINTIKLELEIKQLKERLNNAEREIKDKNSESDMKRIPEVVPPISQNFENCSVRNVGIQSNLSDVKELDDSRIEDLSASSLNKDQLFMLQEKLEEFEKWKEEQQRENYKLLTEINNKMHAISIALETTQNQKLSHMNNENQKSSIEDLETLLTKKVDEIGKATATNFEYVIKEMEVNYTDKLQQLEKELSKLNEQYISQKHPKPKENPIKIEGNLLQATKTQSKDGIFKVVEVNTESPHIKKNAEDSMTKQTVERPLKEISASESNHTFVKYSNDTHLRNDSNNCGDSVSTSGISEDDSTDVSSSLIDEENIEKTENSLKLSTNQTQILNDKDSRLQQAKPKIITKNKAKKLANDRLSSLGVDIKARTLTPVLKKEFYHELNERRNKLKQKHPQFYATRNRIKKFVDKICSTKMPPNAKALLSITKHVRPEIPTHLDDEQCSLSEKEETESIMASTPLNETPTCDNENFKQRLERILASPIRKPEGQLIKAIVHREDKIQNPVPMPRKRVMFNHPDVQQRCLNHSLNLTESE